MELVAEEMGPGSDVLRPEHEQRFVSVVDVNGSSSRNGHDEEEDEGFWFNGDISDDTCLGNGGVTVIRVRDESEDDTRHKLARTRSGSSETGEVEAEYIVNFLGKSGDHAEARLAAKRQARAEAREIRMRELERQQKEAEETADKIYDMHSDSVTRSSRVNSTVNSTRGISLNNSYHSSRRSSEDSLEETASLRDVRHELREVEDKFRKAMIGNAQLDNEKSAAAYQVELYKDKYEELEEAHSQLQREHKEKCRQLEQMRRDVTKLQQDLELTMAALEERDRLIQEQGLVIVGGDTSSSGDESDNGSEKKTKHKRALVSADMAALLESVGHGSLDVRLKRLAAERNELSDELRHVKLELEEERARGSRVGNSSGDLQDIQREANKQLGDYKFKLQKAEQDVSTLQANVARLESQVVRYKTAAETAEKVEDDLKSERRKLQREVSKDDNNDIGSNGVGNNDIDSNGTDNDIDNSIDNDIENSGTDDIGNKGTNDIGNNGTDDTGNNGTDNDTGSNGTDNDTGSNGTDNNNGNDDICKDDVDNGNDVEEDDDDDDDESDADSSRA